MFASREPLFRCYKPFSGRLAGILRCAYQKVDLPANPHSRPVI
jgi:hypothetical protein